MGSTGSNDSLVKKVDDWIDNNKVMVFSKSYCPYCKMAKQSLNDLKVDYEVIELDNEDNGTVIQDILKKKTGASTVPRVFVNKKCIGGGTETQTLHRSGMLIKMINGED